MSAALKKRLEGMDPQGTVRVCWLLEQLAAEEAGRVVWVGTARASEILGEPERRVRRLAARWERMQANGNQPEVRVCRKSGAAHSHLLLCEEDCWELRRARGAAAIVPDTGAPEDEDEAIADEIVRRHFG